MIKLSGSFSSRACNEHALSDMIKKLTIEIEFMYANIELLLYLIVGCVFEYDLYWSGEVGCGTSITLKTGRDDWRSQTKHTVF